MHLFISYARVDKHRCKQIIDLLDMHDVWYDQRLHIGQKWWDEIVKRLHWCNGFVFLVSPFSLESEYCKRELEIAISLKKEIFPVVIEPGTEVPAHLKHIQYADLTKGLDVTTVKTLLSAIFIAERKLQQVAVERAAVVVAAVNAAPTPTVTPVVTSAVTPSAIITPPNGKPDGSVLSEAEGKAMFDDAVRAFRSGDYDKAVFLFKQVQESRYMSRFININAMVREAESALERQAYVREAQREYGPIALLMKDESTRSLGCTAFRAFQATFPDYDPDNLKAIYDQTILTQPPFDLKAAMPLLEWCRVPAGKVMTERNRSRKSFEVTEFFISKYPVTNAQFQAFIDAPDGYKNPVWWQSSLEVRRWHADHPKAIEAPASQPTHPRTYVCWYEATAFCQWLSYKTGWTVKLPTEQQWQRGAQGDTGNRYPWGSRFDATLCTTKESETKGSTPVTQYPKSASPYGVCDLLGNVWEWCSNGTASGEITDVTVDILRVVRGGSFMSPKKRTNINFHYFLNPLYRYQSIGFRIVCETGAEFLGV
ncbi:MAG: SUMF1/EgtB/PvdO family nonheme iron enzyme [Anaerolineae bacterium]|nr:SUMF1/EgtB/PvdO family nonheme iron enzyme [Anaerolineae bacterium]